MTKIVFKDPFWEAYDDKEFLYGSVDKQMVEYFVKMYYEENNHE